MTECTICEKDFVPPLRNGRPCWQTKTCSKKCSIEQKKRRHRTQAYADKNRAGRDARRKTNPSAEYRSLLARRPWKVLHNGKRSHAKRLGIPFALTDKWFEEKYKCGCAITGIAFERGQGKIGPLSASIDRINHAKGYTLRNCRMILFGVNALRGTGNDDSMYRIAKAIIKRRIT